MAQVEIDTAVGDAFPYLFSPITIGTMSLRNRVMMPPHSSAIGNLWGIDEEALRNMAYTESRVQAGVAWIDTISAHVRNTMIPGFEPTGVGAVTDGNYRAPYFVDRIGEFADRIHALGASITSQLVHQGGMPHGPSADRLSAPVINLAPHALDRDEIAWFVKEYAFCGAQAQRARLDGVEVHLNHDDILEWFLSPLTNHRDDQYGGSMENRARFALEAIRAIRDEVGDNFTIGVRLNLREEVPGGYDEAGGIQIAQYLESTGLIDYLHVVMGSPWGNPSYIQPHAWDSAPWAETAGALKRAVSLPVVHTGRVNAPDVAEAIIAAGHADVVGIARAHIADGQFLLKAREGRVADIRPCVGNNECISRRYVEGLGFGCSVNPHTSHEIEGPWPTAPMRKKLLVIGGGPAGMELAALASEGGHEVTLWEGADRLGGQLLAATAAPRYEQFTKYLTWQQRRLEQVGVEVVFGKYADASAVRSAGADVVAIATGATPRRPHVPGADLGFVFDNRAVLEGRATIGKRVVVIAQDDHMAPLAIADYLSGRGHDTTIVYATTGPAPLLGRYIIGSFLGRLDHQGVQFRFMEELESIEPGAVTVRNVYSWQRRQLTDVDTVVLACGGVSDSALYDELKHELPEIHLLGDAYAPRRMVFATRQAYALARILVDATHTINT
jgi:2,4-dienoyl-CoA reductase-like NADH-dependent reductase (Old Yellow Enzyme family)/thioredoxin reductase